MSFQNPNPRIPSDTTIFAKATKAMIQAQEMTAKRVEEAVTGSGEVDALIKKEQETEKEAKRPSALASKTELGLPAGKKPETRFKFTVQDDSTDDASPRPKRRDSYETPAFQRKMTMRGAMARPSVFLHPFSAKGSGTSHEVLDFCREYDHTMAVEVKLTFLKINDIDTLSQQFEAEVYVQTKWEEPAFRGVTPKELDNLLPDDLWDPHLIILNIAGEFDQERRSFVVRYEEGYESPVVLHRWRFKGLFRKALELRYFPFDVQDLTIQLSTERSYEEIKMTHDTHHLSSVNTRTFQDSQEWSIYNHVQCDYRNTTVEYASSTIHPIIVFSCRVRRRVGYFVWNIVFIVFLVLILSLLSVAVEPTTPDRLASTMTLFLTMVAFKLVVKQSLPTISYLTYLDIYVLGSLMYLVLYAMENCAMISLGRWMDHELVEAYDEFFCMFLGALLTLAHLAFIVHVQVTALRRHREMSENDRRYAIQARALARKFGGLRKGGKSK